LYRITGPPGHWPGPFRGLPCEVGIRPSPDYDFCHHGQTLVV